MNKITFIVLSYILSIKYTFSSDIEDSIIPGNTSILENDWLWKETLTSLFTFTKDSIFWLLALISIAVFIFIWARLIMAQWNPEEFKKALMQFIYAIVWLAVIAISWGAVKLVSSLNF